MGRKYAIEVTDKQGVAIDHALKRSGSLIRLFFADAAIMLGHVRYQEASAMLNAIEKGTLKGDKQEIENLRKMFSQQMETYKGLHDLHEEADMESIDAEATSRSRKGGK